MIKDLLHRSGIYFTGLFVGKVFSTVVFILMARVLLPTNFGVLTLFVTLSSVITVFGDFGLNQWYQKHVVPKRELGFLQTVVVARICMLFATLVATSVFLCVTKTFSVFVSELFLLTLIPEAFLSVCDGYYLEKKHGWMVSLKIPSKMAVLLAGYLFFQKQFSLDLSVLFIILGSAGTLVWFFPWKVLAQTLQFSARKIYATLRDSAAYAILIVTSFFYARGDSLVIQYTLGSTSLGLYGAAYRYLESLSLLPTAVAQNLFPVSAKRGGVTRRQLGIIVLAMTLIGVCVAVVAYVFADVLTVGILGEAYRPAAQIVRIFAVVIVLFFVNSPLSTVVQSSRFVHRFLPFGVANTILNIALNVLLVPSFGIQAAAWVMFVTETTGLLINLFFTVQVYRKKYAA